MRCILCERLSWKLLCKQCLKNLEPSQKTTRVLSNGLKVYSFYKYDEISPIILSKYKIWGSEVFKLISKITFTKFAKEFEFNEQIYAISIDDNTKSGYSHTAILAKALSSNSIKPAYKCLIDSSNAKYTGKSLKFRQKNPRKFTLNFNKNTKVILVDDLITTGQTMLDASKVLKKHKVEVLFGLCLADAKEF